MSRDVPLTVLDRDFNEMVRNTPSGMAHWAGTGPKGRTCRECLYFGGPPGSKPEYNTHGLLKKAKCLQYTTLSHRDGRPIPHDSAACKFFHENDKPPPSFKLKQIGM